MLPTLSLLKPSRINEDRPRTGTFEELPNEVYVSTAQLLRELKDVLHFRAVNTTVRNALLDERCIDSMLGVLNSTASAYKGTDNAVVSQLLDAVRRPGVRKKVLLFYSDVINLKAKALTNLVVSIRKMPGTERLVVWVRHTANDMKKELHEGVQNVAP